jgi:TolB-like protein
VGEVSVAGRELALRRAVGGLGECFAARTATPYTPTGNNPSRMRMTRLIEKLRERRTGEWSLSYAVGAAITYEVLDVVSGNFGWHPAAMQVITVLLAAGLPIVVVISWFHGEKGRQRVRSTEVLALGAILVVAASLSVSVARDAVRDTAPGEVPLGVAAGLPLGIPGSGAPGVVVLPFDVVGGSDQDSQLAAQLHSELISRLTRSGQVSPIMRESVLARYEAGTAASEVADLFGVRYAVSGIWLSTGTDARVTVQLGDAELDRSEWDQPYTVAGEDPLRDVDAIAQAVAEVVVDIVAEGAEIPEIDPDPLDPIAHAALLDGLWWNHQRTHDGLARAIGAFATAIAEDGDYARAYASLSNALVLWVTYDYRGIDHYNAYAWASALAEYGTVLGPGMADTHLARGFVLSKAWAPADRAEPDFEVALARKPGSADVLGWYAFFLAREGRYDAALSAAQRAIDLDAYTSGRYVGYIFDALGAGRPDLALEKADQVIELNADLPLPRAQKAFALLLLERAEECLELDLSNYPAIEAMCLHSLDRTDEASRIAELLVDEAEAGANPPYLEAYFAWTGSVEETFRWLHRSYDRSPNGPDPRIIQSGIFDPVRDQAPLDEWLREIRAAAWTRVEREARSIDVSLGSIRQLAAAALAASAGAVTDGP